MVTRADKTINTTAQATATAAIIEEFWKEDWFAGGFVWKWFTAHQNVGGLLDNRFTPQNKPADETIRMYFNCFTE